MSASSRSEVHYYKYLQLCGMPRPRPVICLLPDTTPSNGTPLDGVSILRVMPCLLEDAHLKVRYLSMCPLI